MMSFGSLLRLIPPTAKTIYVFTEFGNRLKGTPLENAASHILHRLYAIISTALPEAVVVVKRGGNEATAVSQLTLAKQATICSPSTFCFWSAVAQTNHAYVPGTSYIGLSGGTMKHVKESMFHDKFHWVSGGPVFNNFTKDTDYHEIVKTLSRDVNKTVLQKSHSKFHSFEFKN